jgi:uncharacterized membrane protein YhaH (DUF805 family)
MPEVLEGNLTWLKFPLALAISLLSVGVVFRLRGRPHEEAIERAAVVGVTLLKIVGCVLLYTLAPLDDLGSDARRHYFPQALRVLAGEIPHRDFTTSYGLLFPYLLAPGLLLWRSVGAVVLTMILVETAMLAVYVRRCRKVGFSGCWRVLFLYVFSPISWYWVAVTGTNGPILACAAMLGLTLAESRRDVASGIAAALGLLFSKNTWALCGPALNLSRRPGILPRGAPALLVVVGLAVLSTVDVNVGARAMNYEFRATSGNLWFLLSMLTDIDLGSVAVKRLSMLSLLVVLGPLCLLFWVGRVRGGLEGFDSAAALLSATHLIFMILSYKTYPWYFAAFLPFVLHTLLADGELCFRRLLPLIYFGAITNLEPRYWMLVRGKETDLLSSTAGPLFALDVVMLCAIAYWAVFCIRRSRP